MNNELVLKTIEESMLPVVSGLDLELEFNDGHYSIVNFDGALEQLKELSAKVDEYQYHPDDRKSVKQFKAAVNKYSSNFTKVVNATQKELFKEVNDQKKQITSVMNEISRKLDNGLKEDDARLKAIKYETLYQAFQNAKPHFDKLAKSELLYEHVSSSSWLNLTTSETSAIKELDIRLTTVNDLCANPLNSENDPVKTAAVLALHGWDGLKALNAILAEKQAIEDREAALAKGAERALSQDGYHEEDTSDEAYRNDVVDDTIDDSQRFASVIVNAEDVEKVVTILRQLKVDFKVVY